MHSDGSDAVIRKCVHGGSFPFSQHYTIGLCAGVGRRALSIEQT